METNSISEQNPLGSEKISKLVYKIALPSMLAQFVSVLYSIVDRMYVGNIPEVGNLSLAGVGVCGPIVTMIGAFASWVGIGGTPLMGIALGEGRHERAQKILANSFVMLCTISVAVGAIAALVREPMLYLFGASDATFPYAERYFLIYISGTLFALVSTGMNQFIIAQGYAKTGMLSIVIGAVMNIILDPVFIYIFDMGVSGAALATIISQAASAAFVVTFLLKKSNVRITFGGYDLSVMGQILKLGLTPFLIIAVDNVMIITMNALLQKYGGANGDALINCNTIVQSFMLVLTMPLGGISGGTQGIISYNYGACNSERVLKAQKYIFGLCIGYTALLLIAAQLAGGLFASLFTQDSELITDAWRAIKICTLAVIPLGAQYTIVDGFTAMGQVHLALPLSFWRKLVYFATIIVIPLIFEADMIFYAETISDIFGPLVSIPVYMLVIKKLLAKRIDSQKLKA